MVGFRHDQRYRPEPSYRAFTFVQPHLSRTVAFTAFKPTDKRTPATIIRVAAALPILRHSALCNLPERRLSSNFWRSVFGVPFGAFRGLLGRGSSRRAFPFRTASCRSRIVRSLSFFARDFFGAYSFLLCQRFLWGNRRAII